MLAPFGVIACGFLGWPFAIGALLFVPLYGALVGLYVWRPRATTLLALALWTAQAFYAYADRFDAVMSV